MVCIQYLLFDATLLAEPQDENNVPAAPPLGQLTPEQETEREPEATLTGIPTPQIVAADVPAKKVPPDASAAVKKPDLEESEDDSTTVSRPKKRKLAR